MNNTTKTKILKEIQDIILEQIDSEEYLTKFLYPLWYNFFVYVQKFLSINKNYIQILKEKIKKPDKKLDKKKNFLFLEILGIINILNIYNIKEEKFEFEYVKKRYFKTKMEKSYFKELENINSTLTPIFADNRNITFFDLRKMKNFFIGLIKEKELRAQVFTDIVLLEFDNEIRDLFKNSIVISSKEEIELKKLSNIKKINNSDYESKKI